MSRQHQPTTRPGQRGNLGQTIFLASVVAGSVALLGYMMLDSGILPVHARDRSRQRTLDEIPFDGAQAYSYLKSICDLGPRPSGSHGMEAQQKLLAEHFQQLGGTVHLQEFRARHPMTGEVVPMANMIVEWHPMRRERILLCAHYDTRPYPDKDPVNPRGTFVGANDGASGTALLMELGRHMASAGGSVSVDFVLFDGEEFVFDESHPYFLGSEYFARAYVSNPPSYRYRRGVLLDMVGDADLQIYQERNSMGWRDTRGLVREIWDTAQKLGLREFISRKKFAVRDDHLKLHDVAKIPTCDIIDLDYPYWHTTGDTPDKCSALSLAKVGWVLEEWLKVELAKP